jgi:hypothetical protein
MNFVSRKSMGCIRFVITRRMRILRIALRKRREMKLSLSFHGDEEGRRNRVGVVPLIGKPLRQSMDG